MSRTKTKTTEPAATLFPGAQAAQEAPSDAALSRPTPEPKASQDAPASDSQPHLSKKTKRKIAEAKANLDAKPEPKAKTTLPARREAQVIAVSDPADVMRMIAAVATNKDVEPERLDKLLALQERIMDRAAKAAYDRALAEMQPHLPIIDRKGRIVVREKDKQSGERTGKIQQDTPYAKWEDINEAMTPVLSHFGFAQSFRVDGGAGAMVVVTCILSHEAGHREQTTISLPHDASGSKNAVQAVGSSISYGKRYTSGLLLNFTTRGEDDDAKSTGGPKVVGEPLTAEELTQLIDQCEAEELKREALVKYLNKSRPEGHPELTELKDLPRSRWQDAQNGINAWREEQKRRRAEPKKEGAK